MSHILLKKAYLVIIGFFFFHFLLVGQTPDLVGWSSQAPLAMSKQQCYNKAVEALKSAGLSNIRTLDNWTASASNYNIRAGIDCVSCGNGVMASVSVAATHEYAGTNEMRDYLKNYMIRGTTSATNESYRNIHGDWICNYKCPAGGVGSTARFEQDGKDLVIFNEGGQRYTGFLKDWNTIVMHSPSLTATISVDGKKVTWSNGTIWVR